MLMVCKDNEGKLYCHDGALRKDMWRDDITVKAKDADGVIHTAHFHNSYEAAVFLHYAEWDEIECDDRNFHVKMFHLFLTEIWAPEDARDRVCYYIADHLMEPMYYEHRSEINRFRIYPQLFVNYCLDSLVEVGVVKIYGDIVFSVDQALLAILRGRIYTLGGCK